jgi:hypothetical protein
MLRRSIALRSAFSPAAGNFWGNPRSILRDADRTFRQLEKFVDRVTESMAVRILLLPACFVSRRGLCTQTNVQRKVLITAITPVHADFMVCPWWRDRMERATNASEWV